MLFYRAALDLSRSARRFVADLIRRHRHRVGSRWRRLPPDRQALLVLVHLRRNETFAALAAAFGVGAATAHRYVTEVIELLADLAPDLRQAMRIAQRKAYVILDGTLVATDRLSGADDRLHYSGKHRRHGMNVQFPTDPHGELIWASPTLPGATHDLTAARQHCIIDALTDRAIACYADKGYVSAGGAVATPYKRKKHRKLDQRKKLFNQHHAKVPALGERGAAALKGWHILRKARCSTSPLSTIVQAILTLHHQDR
ncbi:transposase family protein [Actinomadura sp. WMMA1423]|uniref:transposase family protein n=1 Tax=Actinomadura sp. WMMA1423 TaxID=2591108 RepID=UPI0011472B06|nr:transposase family protein [Actinomadura sp. WMMA1423]